MNKEKVYWKVVYSTNMGKRLVSPIVFGWKEVDYTEKGVWIYPNEGENQFLFIFKTRQNARDLRTHYFLAYGKSQVKIIKVHARVVSTHQTNTLGQIVHASDFLKGTLFCESLMVVGKA